ncbi:GGDEF domain-containing protein [Motilibacter rhizosphaerae]|uniref:GGDEF domain-containing protein n=1 Tax=Motilibacter rhizosphaerae TaxID=598652 RepID=UPI00102D0E90|nr:GGDEF domain-containing protein [Motilibacter rhizosphaerae]
MVAGRDGGSAGPPGPAEGGLVALLAALGGCGDEEEVARTGLEHAVRALGGTRGCVLHGGDPVAWLGVEDREGARALVAAGGAVAAAGAGDDRLLVAGCGPLDGDGEELLAVLAGVLGLALRTARAVEAARGRQRLAAHLHDVQRALAHRSPHAEVLQRVVSGAHACLSADDREGSRTSVHLRLHGTPEERGTASAGDSDPDAPGAERVAAPVSDLGAFVGALVATRTGRGFSALEEADLRAFAEQVGLALTGARTARAVEDALHDSITGLPGRAHFLETLDRALLEEGGDLALLFVDLDRFKEVNDLLGHAAGDELLVVVADRLRSAVRGTDVAARLGGDEFAVLVRDPAGPEVVAALAERIIRAVSSPVALRAGTASVGASVGVALREPGVPAADLLAQADTAMYAAKRAGRGRFRVHGGAGDDSQLGGEQAAEGR